MRKFIFTLALSVLSVLSISASEYNAKSLDLGYRLNDNESFAYEHKPVAKNVIIEFLDNTIHIFDNLNSEDATTTIVCHGLARGKRVKGEDPNKKVFTYSAEDHNGGQCKVRYTMDMSNNRILSISIDYFNKSYLYTFK